MTTEQDTPADTLPYKQPSRTEEWFETLSKYGVTKAIVYGLLGVFLVWTLFPIYWLVTATLKTRQTLLSFPPQWIPLDAQFGNFARLFAERPEFLTYIINSTLVTVVTTVLATTIGAMAAYAFVSFDYPYNLDFHLPFYILSTRFMPPIVTIIPLFVIFRNLGLVNTLQGLILVYTMFNIPFAVWMMKGFFEEVPESLVESAMIDGHTHIGAFFKIVLPLVKPGLVASAIFTTIITWNELLFAVILALNDNAITVPVGLASFVTKFSVQWINMSVAATIALAPVLVFAFVARQQLVRGFSMGAVGK
ncbi:binding-protein-dependent transporters inner membrane component [Halogeometricum pallidum JCM 14848]|uniref:Binding-protein-dependent transporters inner membrane component n=1 Tax=Halogeometricum pallidum JCM 14848 TaxID=1227487 RepID=M0CXN7_HALPD|nr:carbohydrate ABC transporter permease [Halogeometricum pallidum]ELZ27975.1 binding-protein-dependent transporters inner membrane component [Halogeometricum pallidum JCM 14848]